jgi:hypothetical protein
MPSERKVMKRKPAKRSTRLIALIIASAACFVLQANEQPIDTNGKWVCWIDKDSTGPRSCKRTYQVRCNTCTEYDGGGAMCTALACGADLPHAPADCQPKSGETKVCDK